MIKFFKLAAVQAAAIVVALVGLGAGAGWLWTRVWSPAHGEVYQHQWYPYSWDRSEPASFSAVGTYVTIGFLLGLVVGAIAVFWLDANVLASLGAIVVGGVVSALVMKIVGIHIGPGDPQVAAKTLADGKVLSSQLIWGGWPLYGVVAFGGLLPWLPSVVRSARLRATTVGE